MSQTSVSDWPCFVSQARHSSRLVTYSVLRISMSRSPPRSQTTFAAGSFGPVVGAAKPAGKFLVHLGGLSDANTVGHHGIEAAGGLEPLARLDPRQNEPDIDARGRGRLNDRELL